ncbi:MAG: chemotaxis protein [Pseudorhodobacter sp. PARRP1]|nr:MAG: chemotaxis protein [Pseudorhodobacter sp. PARRP1]
MISRTSELGSIGRSEQGVPYNAKDFERISQFLHSTAGIRLDEANERMVYARLAARVQQLGFPSFAAYIDMATSPKNSEERDRLISALTTNTTHFYRESHHFDYLSETVLPELVARARAGERIRIWSAGCSTGEEAYSIAICLLAAFPDAASHDIKILATDIDREALERAKAANYAPAGLRSLAKAILDQRFDAISSNGHRTPKPAVKSLVTFRQLNLMSDWPFSGQFDVIFCRNVAIYMDALTQERIWTRFQQVMRPSAHLFIGHSERLSASLKSSFALVGKTIYRHI